MTHRQVDPTSANGRKRAAMPMVHSPLGDRLPWEFGRRPAPLLSNAITVTNDAITYLPEVSRAIQRL